MGSLPDHDLMLAVRLETWRAVPATVEGIATWDADVRRDFLLELAVEESTLAYLDDQAARGNLTAAQRERLAAVQGLVAARRPILDAYLAAGASAAPR